MKLAVKRDLFVIAAVLALAGIIWFGYRIFAGNQPAKAEIYYKSELVKSFPLQRGKEESFSLPQAKQVVFHIYEDGSVAFIESDCRDKICIHSGPLKWIGQSAACLPNKLILKIVPFKERTGDEVDMIG